jgi:predicted transcriptional regulator
MKNRSKTDIIASILEVIKEGGSKRGKIMYGAYLSYTQLNEYLSLFLEM